MEENFEGPIDVGIDGMPSIKLESYEPKFQASMFERLSIATQRRRFSLRENWRIELNQIHDDVGLNGIIEIPAKSSDNKSIVFDGATIPFPWLISLLSIGILRPLGVILIGSIVHDYAYQYGVLRVSRLGHEFREVSLSRHQADRLFRDIVSTVNRLPAVGYLAWFAVRLGWLWTKYDGKRFGGKAPIAEYLLLALIVLGIYFLHATIGTTVLICIMLAMYWGLFISSSLIVHYQGRI
jgi:hypothetical protein